MVVWLKHGLDSTVSLTTPYKVHQANLACCSVHVEHRCIIVFCSERQQLMFVLRPQFFIFRFTDLYSHV